MKIHSYSWPDYTYMFDHPYILHPCSSMHAICNSVQTGLIIYDAAELKDIKRTRRSNAMLIVYILTLVMYSRSVVLCNNIIFIDVGHTCCRSSSIFVDGSYPLRPAWLYNTLNLNHAVNLHGSHVFVDQSIGAECRRQKWREIVLGGKRMLRKPRGRTRAATGSQSKSRNCMVRAVL